MPGQRKVVNQERVRAFARKLAEWDWRVLRSMSVEENAARIGNEFWDLYYGSFLVANLRKGRKDMQKP